MNKRSLQVLVALSMAGSAAFAQQERVIKVENHLRVGHDSNYLRNSAELDTAFITDIVNLSATMNFSARSDLLLYWQPELQYRFDAEDKFITYQDLYAKFNHALSQRAFLTLSDRFRYQQQDGQADGLGTDQNYIENDLLGSLAYQLSEKSDVQLGAGYEFRIWDDDAYGALNDFEQVKLNATYLRTIAPEKTTGVVGLNYVNHEYDGSRGGFDTIAAMLGVDQTFSSTVSGFGRVGASFNDVDTFGVSNNSTSPYLQAGLKYKQSARTSMSANMGYSTFRSANSTYNAQDRFNLGLGLRHDLTAKINLASSISYIHSMYDSDYAQAGAPDAKDNLVTFSLRCAYEINRNNFVEAGYKYNNRSSDTFNDWDGNRVDVAWRLRL